jgi:hypothetical protein
MGESICEVTVGETYLRVDASSAGGLEVVDWLVGGVPHLSYEGFAIRNLDPVGTVDLVLQNAQVTDETATIVAVFVEAAGSLRATATFVVSDSGDASTVEETLTVQSLAGTLTGRLYAVTDFDLDDTALDDSIVSNPSGTLIAQIEGGTTATVEVISDPAPDAFQVSLCCELDNIVTDNVTFPLSGATSVPGPDDFQSALSWDRTLAASQLFSVTLRKSITIPEPSDAVALGAAFVTLLALARRLGTLRPGIRCERDGGAFGPAWPRSRRYAGGRRKEQR